MRKITFKAALKKLGAVNINLRKSKGRKIELSGFIDGTGLNPAPFIFSKPIFDFKTYYVSYSRDAFYGLPNIMYRTVKDKNDSIGGVNQYNFEKIMNDLGYTVI